MVIAFSNNSTFGLNCTIQIKRCSCKVFHDKAEIVSNSSLQHRLWNPVNFVAYGWSILYVPSVRSNQNYVRIRIIFLVK